MYCVNCGSEIKGEGAFCDACGTQIKSSGRYLDGSISELPVDTPKGEMGEQAQTWTAFISIVVVAVLAVLLIYLGVNHISLIPSFSSLSGDSYTSESYDEGDSYTSESYDEEDSSNENGEVYTAGYGEFVVGGTYYVNTNTRVREGPGTEYRILERYELTDEDYAKSVDSDTTTDALIEEGQTVECLEMSGDWMRISSGWVCVYYEGEQLIE